MNEFEGLNKKEILQKKVAAYTDRKRVMLELKHEHDRLTLKDFGVHDGQLMNVASMVDFFNMVSE